MEREGYTDLEARVVSDQGGVEVGWAVVES